MELDLEVAINLTEGEEEGRKEGWREKGRKISHVTGTYNLFPSFFVVVFVFQYKVSLCSLGCPGTRSVD